MKEVNRDAERSTGAAGEASEKPRKPLTAQKQRFVEEYVAMLPRNATQAAIRAGYSERTAKQQASRLLTSVDVKAAIAALDAERAERLKFTADNIIEETRRIALFDPRTMFGEDGKLLAIPDMPEDVAHCVAGMKVEREKTTVVRSSDDETVTVHEALVDVKQHDKLKALDLGWKYHRLLPANRVELSGKVKVERAKVSPYARYSTEDVERVHALEHEIEAIRLKYVPADAE